eukprot:gene3204-5520_t
MKNTIKKRLKINKTETNKNKESEEQQTSDLNIKIEEENSIKQISEETTFEIDFSSTKTEKTKNSFVKPFENKMFKKSPEKKKVEIILEEPTEPKKQEEKEVEFEENHTPGTPQNLNVKRTFNVRKKSTRRMNINGTNTNLENKPSETEGKQVLKSKLNSKMISKPNQDNTQMMNYLKQTKYQNNVPNAMKKETITTADAMKMIGLQTYRFNNFEKFRDVYKKSAICKQNRIRSRLVNEIYQTEKEYVTSLTTLNEVYYLKLQSKKLIDSEDLRQIFGNIPMILEFQKKFLASMNDEMTNYSPKIGKCFVAFALYLKAYPEYINTYDDNINLLNNLQTENKSFEAFLLKRMQFPECGNLPVESFLVKPIQRIPRYKLLLRDLLKETPENHVDFQNLQIAYEKIDYVAGFVNEQKREAENRKVVLNLRTSMPENIQSILLIPGRKLVKFGNVQIKTEEISEHQSRAGFEEVTLYLFNDLILIIEELDVNQIDSQFSIVDISETEASLKIFTKISGEPYFITFKFPEKEFDKWSAAFKSTSKKIHDNNVNSLNNDITINQGKLKKLEELIAQQEAELSKIESEIDFGIENKMMIQTELSNEIKKAKELDKIILRIVHDDLDTYKTVFDCEPVEAK